MKRHLILFPALLLLALLSVAAAPQHRGGGGSQGSNGPGMQGPQHQQRGPQDPRGGRQTDPARKRAAYGLPTRLHDCQQACVRAREESQQLQRYADRQRFDAETARRLGRQLREHLAVMDREHALLPGRLTAGEREQHRQRLERMDRFQHRWQEELRGLDEEMGKDSPNREELRQHARAIEKEIKNYRKELDALEKATAEND